MDFIKPKIIISKCLEFDACRYDAKIINNQYIEKLKPFIEFKPICPEVEIGMGTPRRPVRIIYDKDRVSLYQESTGNDFSAKMNKFSNIYLSAINQVDGFILKSSSPSCGIKSTKIYRKSSPISTGNGAGLFTTHVIKKFPYHPKEEEKRLNNIFLREHFYTSIFTLADFRRVNDMNTLYKYHAKHKYLFMAYNQNLLTKMGNIAANKNKKSIKDIINSYYKNLLILLSKRPRHPSNINAQMHIMGYFKNLITSKEKKYFLDYLKLYRSRKTPISQVNNILLSWTIRFENEYLLKQSFFNPFPIELLDNNKSRFE